MVGMVEVVLGSVWNRKFAFTWAVSRQSKTSTHFKEMVSRDGRSEDLGFGSDESEFLSSSSHFLKSKHRRLREENTEGVAEST